MTLASMVPDLDEILNAVYRRLAGDATLQTFLGGAGKIAVSTSVPPGIAFPVLQVYTVFAAYDLDTMTARVLLGVRAVAKNLQRGTAEDRETLGDIVQRAGSLLTGESGAAVLTGSGYAFFDSWVESTAGPMTDPESPEEGFLEARVVLRARRL